MTQIQHYAIAALFQSSAPIGECIQVHGWLRTRRDSKAGFSFLQLSDGSGFAPLQIVADQALSNYSDEVLKLTSGCSVRVEGTLVQSSGKGQGVELQASCVEVIGWVDQPDSYPVQPKRHTMEFLREVAHLRPRTNTFGAVARVRHCVSQAIHQFFHHEGFVWVHTPLITASDAEGAGEMFRVSTLDMANLPRTEQGEVDFNQDFFGREAFLTVSGQLNVESYCLALDKAYTFGPTFRAENSNTSRHLAEFWMVEPEIAFADLDDNAHLAERLLKHICQTLLEEREDDMAFFNQQVDKGCIARLQNFLEAPFAQLDYSEAIERLLASKQTFEFPVRWGIDLSSEHERWLAEKHIGRPVVVRNYPKDIKAFYMRLNDDERTVAAMDVLAPGVGEIIGGAQREERLDCLDQRMCEYGIDPEHLNWYRDLRRYGSVPHAGFGMGLERIISYVTGLANVRDVIPFPRTPRNVSF